MSDSPPPAKQISSRWIWPFELIEQIGKGGMGVVYRARYVKNDKQVAVKLLPEDIADPTILARFERELDLLKSLRHPNIVRSFGGICEDKQRFYAMELVEEGTLRQLLQKRGTLPWEEVCELGKQMCAGLQHAHDFGIVHRDIKPGNFLMGKQDRIKLSDFGLASISAGSKLTSDGKTMGTLHYMPPEQVRGDLPPSPQSDLYALGCVLFEMLTGNPPFVGRSHAQILQCHLQSKPPRVASIVAECPTALDQLINEMLSKRPEDRPKSAKEVSNRLQSCSHTITVRSMESIGHPFEPLVAEKPPQTPADDVAKATSEAPPTVGVWNGLSQLLVVLLLVSVAINFLYWNRSGRYETARLALLEAYKSPNVAVREAAATALGQLGRDDPSIVRNFEPYLKSADDSRRRIAVETLGAIGPNARSALPAITQLERADQSPEVRYAASEAAKSIRTGSVTWGGLTTWAILLLACSGIGWVLWSRVRGDAV